MNNDSLSNTVMFFLISVFVKLLSDENSERELS